MKDLLKNKVKKNKKNKFLKRTKLSSLPFLLPSILGVLVFFVAPFVVVLIYAFIDNPVGMNFVWFDNFKSILTNGAFVKAAKNTAVFSAISVPLAVILSLLLAVVLDSGMPFKSQIRTFFLTPLMVPVASIVLIWQVIFHYNGVINDFLVKFGIDKIDFFKSEYAQLVIVVLFLWKNLGYNMVLFMAGLAAVPKELVEVARLESANRLKIFFTIKMRYLSSTVVFVTIMSLINSFKVFREVYLLTGDYPYDSIYMLQHFMNNKFRALDYQYLSAAAILMSIVMVIIISVLFAVEDRYGKDVEG